MGGSKENEHGLLLKYALERYSDPALWKAYQDSRSTMPTRVRIGSRFMSDMGHATVSRAELAALASQRDRRWLDVLRPFMAMLRSGELVARGYLYPVGPQSRMIPIPAEHWDFLRCDFTSSFAKRGTYTVIGIRVLPRADSALSQSIEGRPQTAFVTTPADRPPSASGTRLRVWQEIEVEMRRRAAAGELTGSIVADCRNISNAVARKLRSDPHVKSVPGGRRIEVKLRELYDTLTDRRPA